MLISALRNIGLATIGSKDEIDIILEEQARKIEKSKVIVVCDIDLTQNTFKISVEDLQIDKIKKYLPGVVTGNSKNLSPFLAIKHQKSSNDKQFSSLAPKDMVNFDKMPLFDAFISEIKDNLLLQFSMLINEKKDDISAEIYSLFEREYLDEKDKGIKVISKNAPKYLVFRINEQFPGEIEAFRRLYLLQKSYGQKKTAQLEDVICLACGKQKDKLIPLEKCKFFDLFSIDQLYFQMGFQKDANQAMICKECELLVRQGYTALNTTLRFEAYRLKIQEKKYKTVYHSIIPITMDVTKVQQFLNHLSRYRLNYYHSKKETLRSKRD